MKPLHKALYTEKKDDTRTILIVGIIILFLQLTFHLSVGAKTFVRFELYISDSIKSELNNQLNSATRLGQLNFPNTVKRFYAFNGLETNWLRPEENISPTVSAMLLLDCVRQYGLQHENYHPKILTYSLMHDVLNPKNLRTAEQKVEFEVMLTDAMISMINHLHYGTQNPYFDSFTIDKGIPNQLNADEFLRNAMISPNLMNAILTVQPKFEQYKQLQGYMKLIAGQYICDSYETPEAEVRKIAMNMERLRWLGADFNTYLHINVPSFDLVYKSADSTYHFKTVVGKPSTPTPTLQSSIYLIETAPDWNVPAKIFIKELLPKAVKNYGFFEENHMAVYDASENMIPISNETLAQIKANPKLYHLRQSAGCDNALGKVVFRFANSYGIYLHDTPDQPYFKREQRALSHGCIRVENAEKLASLILREDNQQKKISTLNSAMNGYIKKQFNLVAPIPVIITYLTCTVIDGMLVSHTDIYQLDGPLEQKIYGPVDQLTKIK